jgi:type II restriction/modification system DNA methylase subunit YeeA
MEEKYMDKNKIKSFAVWARRNLIAAVTDRAFKIGIEENNIQEVESVQGGFKLKGKEEIFNLSIKDRSTLVNQIKEKGFQQVMEEVAYTWFNRFMGLRYMEVNEYLPTGIRVLSAIVAGKTEPDVLTRVSEVIDELSLNGEYIYELLDSGKTEDREEAYKYILVKQCNELGKIIPQMFEKISDYTELLLPDNLLEEGSVIRKMVEDIEEQDWKEEVEIIGWMYQYYISEKKDEVFAALKKNVKITKENIPAATQLFTPKWIVKYMVENSLGRLWLEGHPNGELQKEWKYYLEEAKQESEVEEELKKIREEHSKLKPEDIKVIDVCMGSGHILVYAFDVLYEIYKTTGYSEREIPRMILQNNLYGLDIDDRSVQLATFALIMKARHYNRRLFREIEKECLELNLCSIQESNSLTTDLGKEAVNYFVGDSIELRKDVEYLVDVFTDAKEYGSILEVKEVDFDILNERLSEIEKEDNLMFVDYKNMLLNNFRKIIKQAAIMSNKYKICVTNPPYMGTKGMNVKLSKYLFDNYNESKADLFAVFMEVIIKYSKFNGFATMINQHSWMFLSSFQKLRKKVIEKCCIWNMIHLGSRSFEEIGGEVVQTTSFILRNNKINNYEGSYIDLTSVSNSKEKQLKAIEIIQKNNSEIYVVNNEKFNHIPEFKIIYWLSDIAFKLFEGGKFKDVSFSDGQTKTGNNDKYLRLIWEVNSSKVGKNNKWVFHAKGGSSRKWFGNIDTLIDWSESSRKHYRNDKVARIAPEYIWFRKGITWSLLVSSENFAVRLLRNIDTFNNVGPSMFINNEEDTELYMGLLNSKVSSKIINSLNPTLATNISDLQNMPLVNFETVKNNVIDLVKACIEISKNDWDLFETSWDFKVHPLLKLLDKGEQYNLSAIFRIWETECEEAFEQLKHNEEELNKIFIDIYGLQEELTPEVEDKDITIRKADRERDIKSFISYAVGCILGRYSIDAEGLIYAGGDFKDKWNLSEGKVRKIEKDEEGNIISDSWVDTNFLPDGDNVIPITEDEYFEDDIVARFIQFVKTVYSEETLEDNLDFIADSIGRKPSETARQSIRRYFLKDFYKDHLKVYQKRPIYWLFESGKNDGFKALIYMHRYNEQTVAKVRTDYLHILQRKYEAEINRLQLVVDSEDYTARDRSAAKKKSDRISKQIEECREYDQIVAHLANEQIRIDLDDGVKVNYDKFQGIKVINSKGKEVKMDLLAKI